MYRAVVEVINNPFITSKSERVGVPQYFGISYAMGKTCVQNSSGYPPLYKLASQDADNRGNCS